MKRSSFRVGVLSAQTVSSSNSRMNLRRDAQAQRMSAFDRWQKASSSVRSYVRVFIGQLQPFVGSRRSASQALIFAICLAAASAAQAVTVDAWLFGTATRILDTNVSNPDTSVQTTSGIIGGERESFLQTQQVGQGGGFGTVNVSNGVFSLNLDAETEGVGRFVWDGTPTGDVKDDPFNVSTDGLGGVDLTQSCSGGAPSDAFRFQINQASTGDVAVTIDVWDMDGDTDSVTIVHPQGAGLAILEFPFSSFANVDFDNTSPAVGVGAIRLTIAPEGADEDVVLQEVGTCAYDFGDARGNADNGTIGLQVTSELNASQNDPDGGPRHILQGPILGSIADGETDAQDQNPPPRNFAKAGGDDNDGTNDNDGVTFPAGGMSGVNIGDTYTVSVNVSNVATGDEPLVCGWIDFSDLDGGGTFASPPIGFEDVDNGATDGERVCVEVSDSNTSDPGPGPCDATGTAGEFNCDLAFTVPADFNAGDATTPGGGADSAFLARFRVTNDWSTSADSSFNGFASDGEVEDYLISNSSLPVSIHSFDSRFTDDGLVLEWGTVSETRNAGFHIWVDRGFGMELLIKEMIPSTAVDPLQPQRYRHVISDLEPGDVNELAITAVDYSGTEEMYGLFEAGAKYGETVQPAPIAWDRIDRDVKSRMQTRAAFEKRDAAPGLHGKTSTGASRLSVVDMRADLQVRAAGLHRVTWEDLSNAGLDLNGVRSSDIAVTLNGKPVSRHIVSRATDGTRSPGQRFAMRGAREATGTPEFFGPGAEILFWAEKPGLPDKLYVNDYIYRVSVSPSNVRAAGARMNRGKPGPRQFMARVHRDEDVAYQFATPLADPWYAAWLRADRSNSYSATLEVSDALVSSDPGELTVVVGGLTAFDVNPDHRIRIELNGTVLTDVYFDGNVTKSLKVEVPPGLLMPGNNTVRVLAPGGTAAPFDISLVDTVTLEYPQFLRAADNRLVIQNLPHSGGLTVDGLTTTDTVAYAWNGSELIELNRHQFGRGSVRVPTIDNQGSDYWISAADAVLHPDSIEVTISRDLLVGRSGDFIVVGHPAFLPVSPDESHPLNDYAATRESEGWNVEIFDITAIQREYSNGMPLPGALTKFLSAADRRLAYDHVLLVGGDSYDYTNNLGLGSVSFIPTVYAATSNIRHTPSDSLLTDLDGDGVSDKALGRWPVRTMSDLQSIVTKTLDWSGDSEALSNAVWVTDSQDPSQPSFRAQVGRMVEPLQLNGWIDAEIAAIYFDDVTPSGGMSVADAARASFFDRLEQGRSVSGFIGHGAPAMWTFQGLLTPDDLTELYNEGNPTLIGTLTCYTTYFVSPYSDTVAHRWMNGYRQDAAGNAIPGVPNGAVAIHGAATLSDYGQNERIAKSVLERQLAGQTLGSAILQVRTESVGGGLQDQVINWTLLGDPTLTLD